MPRKKKAEKKKNLNGMGSMRILENGKYEYRFVLGRKPDGSLNRRSVTADDGPAAMERAREAVINYEKKTRNFKNPNSIPVSTLAAVWWEDHQANVRRSTADSYEFTKKHITDGMLGKMPISEVRPQDINAFINQKHDEGYTTKKGIHKDYSTSQVHKILVMLHQMFDYAVEEEWIEINVVDKIVKKKAKRKSKKVVNQAALSISKAWTPAEIQLILKAHNGSWISNAIIVDIFCGAREQELLALDKAHVKPDGSSVTILNALNREGGKYVVGDVKSEAGLRTVSVAAVARPMLVALYNAAVGDMLFPGRGTLTRNISGYRKAYMEYIKKIEGVRPLTPHKGCRHTFGTLLAAVNVAPARIQYLMGHADYRLTANTYTHLEAYFTKEAIDLIKSWGVGDLPVGD